MRWWTELRVRLRALLERRAMERELDEELAFHLERETEKLVDEGRSPREARREARRRFGGVERHREGARDAWGVRWIDDLTRDVTLGLRRMWRAPGTTALTVATLALGLGGTVAAYSVVEGLLLRPLPFDTERGIRVFWSEFDWRGAEFDFVSERVETFSGLAAFGLDAATLKRDDRSVPLVVVPASDELFDVLGARPFLGTTFPLDADRPGAEPVVVLSHGTWLRELGGDPDIVGRRIVLDGTPTTVVGVMPRDFYFPMPDAGAWTPLDLDPARGDYAGNGWLALVGRLRPDAGPVRVDAELDRLTAALGDRFTYPPAWDKTKEAHLTPVREYLVGDVRPVLLLLMAAASLMLVLALANVAALLLARTIDRAGELGVRSALGAGRGRLVRQVVTESVLLAGAGGVVGVTLAVVGFDGLVAALPLRDGFGSTLTLRWPVLGAGVAAALILGGLTSLAPITGVLARGRLSSVRPGARSDGAGDQGRPWLQGALVAAEVVVAVLLVTGASLFVRSAERLYAIDTGFRVDGVGSVEMVVGEDVAEADLRGLFTAAVRRVEALPGVSAAGLIPRLPIRDGGMQGPVSVGDRPDLDGPSRPGAYFRPVTPETFDVLGIDLVQGRAFERADGADAGPVAIVSERFAREVWPDGRALGKRVRSPFGSDWFTVVGVAEDVAIAGARAPVPRVLYVPEAQSPARWRASTLVFRAATDPSELLGAVRSTVDGSDQRLAVARPTTMAAVLEDSFADVLRLRFFFGLLAVLAVAVGATGVYGVVSYAVSRRRPEFGIRMALGAGRERVVGGVLRRQLRPVAAGVVVGLAGAFLAAGAVSGLVYEVRPTDPLSLLAAGGTLFAVGVVAALVPALRATRVDPARTLRAE
ncbi:MAG: ADOP family duplicated permease [Gemmatimonadota bacterium]|jgi:predicted permease